jgi:hypothetical protein
VGRRTVDTSTWNVQFRSLEPLQTWVDWVHTFDPSDTTADSWFLGEAEDAILSHYHIAMIAWLHPVASAIPKRKEK